MNAKRGGLVLLVGMLGLLPARAVAPQKTARPDEARGAAAVLEGKIEVPILGEVPFYRPANLAVARGVVLFLSGDGGWNLGVLDMARRLAPHGVVLGISLPAYRRFAETETGRCWYPAGELEAIARAAEKRLGLPHYLEPVLVGYSSGATLAYGVLAQAPEGAFSGAVSLGFCPDLEIARPLCGRGAWRPVYDARKRQSLLPPRHDLGPGPNGQPRWIALAGKADRVCAFERTVRFVAEIPGAAVVSLPRVGHGFSVPRNWVGAFEETVGGLLRERKEAANPLPLDTTDRLDALDVALKERLQSLELPLVIVWPRAIERVLVFVSGDGGWAEIDREVSSRLASRGTAVVGWNALHYFWQKKTPDRFRADLVRLVEALPERLPIFVGGYSFGAEISAVALARHEEDGLLALGRVKGLVLLAPGPYATFEVSPLDWIRRSSRPTGESVRQAIESASVPVLCLEPEEDPETGCPTRQKPQLERVVMAGGHHFGGDFDGLAARILEFMGEGAGSRGPASPRTGREESRRSPESSGVGRRD